MANLEIKGTLIQKLPVTTAGNAQKQSIIIETEEQFKKNICIDVWKEKIDLITPLPIGAKITAQINIESREYNGKWFTNVSAWKIESDQKQLQKVESKPQSKPVVESDPFNNEQNDDLPF